jgi:hypothetical protein
MDNRIYSAMTIPPQLFSSSSRPRSAMGGLLPDGSQSILAVAERILWIDPLSCSLTFTFDRSKSCCDRANTNG